jgi:hypothetical protein
MCAAARRQMAPAQTWPTSGWPWPWPWQWPGPGPGPGSGPASSFPLSDGTSPALTVTAMSMAGTAAAASEKPQADRSQHLDQLQLARALRAQSCRGSGVQRQPLHK